MEFLAETGTIPFHVIPLIGRHVRELPGRDRGAWERVWEGAEGGMTASRWRYADGVGRVDGLRIPVHVYARTLNDTVWAVGVWAPGWLFVAQPAADDRHGPYLVAVRKQALEADGQINWITRAGGRVLNAGLAA